MGPLGPAREGACMPHAGESSNFRISGRKKTTSWVVGERNRISRVVDRCLAVTAFAVAAVHPCYAFGEQEVGLVALELGPLP